MVEVMGVVLVLVFVERNQDGLAISLRRAQTRRENTVQTRHDGPVDGVCIDRFIACIQATPMVGGSFLCMQV